MSSSQDTQPALSHSFSASASLLQAELQQVLQAMSEPQIQAAAHAILTAKRIFFAGAGRSGLALQMAAMRLMHLGLECYLAGQVTTPPIAAGDLLLVASASGTTASVLHAAQVAHKQQAAVLLLTTAPQSPLAQLAGTVVVIPAASKSDTGARTSQQYAGSLFEQSVLLVFDGLFHSLWKSGTQSSEDLLKRHANLE